MPSTAATKTILNILQYSGLRKVCETLSGSLGSILMLHRVAPQNADDRAFSPNAHLSVTPEFLDDLLSELKHAGFEFVDLDEAKKRITSGKKQPRFVAITLDDGYKDNKTHAAPIFEKYKALFTIFVAPGLVDARATLWWEDLENIIASNKRVSFDINGDEIAFQTVTTDEKNNAFTNLLAMLGSNVSEQKQRQIISAAGKAHNCDLQAHRASSIMNWEELKNISKSPLCTIGAHTIHHYAVARLSKSDCKHELEQSALEIETKLGSRPKHFAYPYGYPAAAGARDFEIVKQCGFETAVTTRHGVCFKEHSAHLTALPRISVNGLFQKPKYVKTLLSGAPTLLQNKGKKLNIS